MNIVLLVVLVSLLPVLVTWVVFHISKQFGSQPQSVGVFWSILVTLIVLELGKTVVLQFAPWMYHLEIKELIGILSLGIAPLSLATFVTFRVLKVSYFAEQSTVDMLRQSLLVTGITAVFIVFKTYEIQSIAEIING